MIIAQATPSAAFMRGARWAGSASTLDQDSLELGPVPPGFEAVDDADGSMRYSGPSLVIRRLEANQVRLIAIRHGQSQSNLDSEKLGQPLLYGQSESPLTELGRQQALDCAAQLYGQLGGDAWMRRCLENPHELPVFVSSPMGRATESSQILADYLAAQAVRLGGQAAGQKLAPMLTVHSDPRLLETHFGRFERHPLGDLVQADPEFAGRWRPPQGMGTEFRHRFPGGESRSDAMMRATSLFNGLSQVHPGRTVVLMTHGEFVLAARTVLGQAPVEQGKVRAQTGVVGNAVPYWLVGQPAAGR